MTKKTLKFINFWAQTQKELLDRFQNLLPFQNFKLSDSPDLLICCVFGMENENKETKKIFFNGENCFRLDNINFKEDDKNLLYLVTNTHQDYPRFNKEKICYFPFFMMEYNNIKLYQGPSTQKKFCAFVVSNNDDHLGCQLRTFLFQKLSRYKKVDSGGKYMNNIGYNISENPKEYYQWLNQYKFVITFENSFGYGYVTEKLFNGLCSGALPIYWGDNEMAKIFFNPNSFLCLETGNNTILEITDGVDNLINQIIYLDTHSEEYQRINSKFPFLETTQQYLNQVQERLKDVLDKV